MGSALRRSLDQLGRLYLKFGDPIVRRVAVETLHALQVGRDLRGHVPRVRNRDADRDVLRELEDELRRKSDESE